ncbi:YciI family protein [Lentzea sp.]|uniref:YciI family protein n=1 Tax=Lentzea sp. TaxID=56099 RepID=UPI002C9284C0|nr:YciI family protein [Lentzea sp.]HUQ59888.1 YciI family protein [Lentzea sp.]
MKYLILIYSNPRSRAAWDKLTEEQQRQFGQDHYDLSDRLRASGELVVSEGLPGPETGKGVSVRDGEVVVTDGPFAEAKEYLAGFYLVEADSIDQVIAHAATLPDAHHDGIEVRPVWDPSVLDDL